MIHASPRAFTAATILILGLALESCRDSAAIAKKGNGSGGDRAAEQAPLVRVEVVARRPVQRKIETTAYLEAEHSVVVLPRVSGRIEVVRVDEAQEVAKGELLASLDDRQIRASLTQADVRVTDKKLRFELAKLEHEATQHREEQGKFELEKATKDLRRLEKLDPDLVSAKDLDNARYDRDTATAALRVTEFQTRKARLDVDTAEQAIKELEAKVAEVRIQLAEHRILAPIAGVISRRMVKGGEAITTLTELFEVVDTKHLIAYLDRPQRELALVRQAKLVQFTTDAFVDREFFADVDVISPVVDRGTGSFKIRVRVRPKDAAVLRPGLFMRAQILTEENREAIMIPKTAVLADGDDSIVFFVREPLNGRGKARRLVLETGIEDDTSIECRNSGTRGLRPGDLIIVSGQQDLKDQTEVEISRDG